MPTPDPTTARDSDATPDATGADVSRHLVALPEAARRLGVGLRTVQRRIERGELSVIERDGKRFVSLASDEIGDATGDATEGKVTRHDATETQQSDATGADMTAHLIGEVKFLRAALEQRDRDAAELRAALRAALKLTAGAALPELTEGQSSTSDATAINRQNATQTGAADTDSHNTPNGSGTGTESAESGNVITYGSIADELERRLKR